MRQTLDGMAGLVKVQGRLVGGGGEEAGGDVGLPVSFCALESGIGWEHGNSESLGHAIT